MLAYNNPVRAVDGVDLAVEIIIDHIAGEGSQHGSGGDQPKTVRIQYGDAAGFKDSRAQNKPIRQPLAQKNDNQVWQP